MRSSAVARRYARALFSLAEETGSVDGVRAELDALGATLEESPELCHAIFRPLHPGAERRAVLESLCDRLGSSPSVRNFCALLVDQRRVIEFDAIREAFGALADQAAGRTRARVVSASPMTDAQQQRLRRALSSRTASQVELDISLDPALLGGAIASVGGLVFDGSLRTQLERLRGSLTRGQ